MSHYEFDLLIAGAGPAGCTLALDMAGKGLSIGIIEKDVFPRPKICGDALSGKVLSVMKRIPGGVYDDFLRLAEKTPSGGIRFTAPNLHAVDIPFTPDGAGKSEPPGYVCRRSDFDNFLFSRLKGSRNISLFEGERISEVKRHPGGIRVITANHEFTGQAVAGADGVHSAVRKHLDGRTPDRRHFCTGIRAYFDGVTGTHPENFIELIFLKELLPGYFWIFPSTGGLVNAGFGMLQSRVIRQRVNLTRMFDDLVRNHPLLAPRFRNATMAGKTGAHTLPLATFRFPRSGDRYLLLGDAAFLVDPFSGEGIGNAMASGEIAADILGACFTTNDFSASAMAAYEARIRRRFSQEFRTAAIMQRLCRSPRLFNLVVDKARKNDELRNLFTAMFTSDDIRKKLTKPGFYAGLLFR